jgi:ribosomal protein S6
MVDDERDQVLAKFEAFLKREECQDINTTIKGRQKLAYPIKKFAEGIYVLYTFAAPPPVSQRIQKLLSTPESGAELNILRHMTFRI